jgi:hypothetical protein
LFLPDDAACPGTTAPSPHPPPRDADRLLLGVAEELLAVDAVELDAADADDEGLADALGVVADQGRHVDQVEAGRVLLDGEGDPAGEEVLEAFGDQAVGHAGHRAASSACSAS